MEQSQVKEITNLALSSVKVGNNDFPIAILPENMKIHSLEKFNSYRDIYRAIFNTSNFDSFVKYTKLHHKDNTQLFINEKNLSSEVIFDIGTNEKPEHAIHRSHLEMEKTAPYKVLCDIQGYKLTQREFSDWIEDWEEYLVIYGENDEEISLSYAIQSIRKLKVNATRAEEYEISDFGEARSAMENVEARSQLITPKFLQFSCIPYKGLIERPFILRISILTGGNDPIFIVRLVRAEEYEESIIEEFSNKLIEAFKDDDIYVCIGTIKI